MDHNRIVISLEFCFRGECFTPSAELDLDALMEKSGALPSFYDLLAGQLGLDSYSYEYDVMLMEPVRIDRADGFAAEYVHDGEFDAEGFTMRWHREQVRQQLARIAGEHLGVGNLGEQPSLEAALLEAWEHGRQAGRSESFRER